MKDSPGPPHSGTESLWEAVFKEIGYLHGYFDGRVDVLQRSLSVIIGSQVRILRQLGADDEAEQLIRDYDAVLEPQRTAGRSAPRFYDFHILLPDRRALASGR